MKKLLVINFNNRIYVPLGDYLEKTDFQVRKLELAYNLEAGENTSLLERAIRDFRPDIILSFGWWSGNIDIDRYEQAVKASGCIHTYWTHDDPLFMDSLSAPMMRFSHFIFTSDGDSVGQYEKKGMKAEFLPMACDPRVHCRTAPLAEYTHDIVLIANNYNTRDYIPLPNRMTGIRNILIPLLNRKYSLGVYGLWWTEEDRLFRLPKKFWKGRIIPGNEGQAYSSCKIGLGLLSVDNSRTMLSMRVFEAMGSGILYFSQYSPSLGHFFENHRHLVWSQSPQETVHYIDYYLSHEEKREEIAREGRRQVYENHTYAHRADQIAETLRREFNV